VNYFTNLDAWKIERQSAASRDSSVSGDIRDEELPPEPDDLSDLPF
jgi:hypothetical protein